MIQEAYNVFVSKWKGSEYLDGYTVGPLVMDWEDTVKWCKDHYGVSIKREDWKFTTSTRSIEATKKKFFSRKRTTVMLEPLSMLMEDVKQEIRG